MRFSLDWIRRYVDVEGSPRSLAERLTLAGLPVDQIEEPPSFPDTVVVARILEVKPHPDADRLSLCQVDAGGKEILSVVCGAPNARAGLYSPLALVGTTLPGGMKVKEARIRGERSQGMLCSEDELGLGDDHSGIIELQPGEPGTPLHRVLGSGGTAMEIDVPSNRGDCLSHLGLAREIAALTGRPLRVPEFKVEASGKSAASSVSVTVEDPEDCPRFTAHVLRDVSVGPSPEWLVRALESAGQRSINNVVDVTNFVLLETGQPSHAFDLDRLGTGRIHVRRARAGERLVTLDDTERALHPDVLVITDGERPIAAAGVMGGASTEVHSGTKNVVLEVACFRPERVLWGSRRLRLDTDASLRFRRGVDPVRIPWAAERIVALLTEVSGAKAAPAMVDVVDPRALEPRSVTLRPARVGSLLGQETPDREISERLTALGFQVHQNGSSWKVDVPSWRRDVAEECDLIEEVARHRGYDAIGERLYNGSGAFAPVQPEEERRRTIGQALQGFGFQEVITRNLTRAAREVRAELDPEAVAQSFVTLLDPPTQDEEGLRVSLLPSLMEVIAHNLRHGQTDVLVYELGKTFHRREELVAESAGLFREGSETGEPELPIELSWVGLGATGGDFPPSLERQVRPGTFHAFKGVIEELLSSQRIDSPKWRSYNGLRLVPEGALEVVQGDRSLGFAWEVPERVREGQDLSRPVYLAQIRLDLFPLETGTSERYREPSRFPPVRRDLALVVPLGVLQAELREWIRSEAGPHLAGLELFDRYRGKHIPEGRLGLGYRLVFRALDRTLEENEVDAAVERIVMALARRDIVRREA